MSYNNPHHATTYSSIATELPPCFDIESENIKIFDFGNKISSLFQFLEIADCVELILLRMLLDTPHFLWWLAAEGKAEQLFLLYNELHLIYTFWVQ